MNPFSIGGAEVSILDIPLRTAFVTALGSKTRTRNAALRLRLAGGGEGYGEASGSLVQARFSAERLAAALGVLARSARGRDARAVQERVSAARRRYPDLVPATAAFECALLSAVSAQSGLPLARWFGGSVDELETDVTISAWPPETAGRAALQAARRGFRTLKVKVGTGAEDLARALAVGAARPTPRLVLDGNQGLTASSALRLVEGCLEAGLDVALLEQPLPREDLAGMARLQRRCPVPLAADESVRSAADARRVLELGAARVLNVKVAKTGLLESLEIVSLARAAGAELMIGCMQESARGLEASVHLACGTGAFEFVDLDSDCLLAASQPRGDYRRRGPRIFI